MGAAADRPAEYIVEGRVFCDTCRAGFETSATTYISGAEVRVECRKRSTGERVFSAGGVTDQSGSYRIAVPGEHGQEICESVLVSSSEPGCASPVAGRERARVVLCGETGIVSNKRSANSLGFQKDVALPACADVLKLYQQQDS